MGRGPDGDFSIGVLVFLASLMGIIPIFLGGMALASGQIALGTVLVAAGVLLLMLVALISSALDSILLAALYLYAVEGAVPEHFNDDLLHDAFARGR